MLCGRCSSRRGYDPERPSRLVPQRVCASQPLCPPSACSRSHYLSTLKERSQRAIVLCRIRRKCPCRPKGRPERTNIGKQDGGTFLSLRSVHAGLHSPFVWSKSSVIYTAHPSQPWVIARHFPTSRQWILAVPSPVVVSPELYEPPSLISVAPTDEWLFAYYPGRGGAGQGCLWRCGAQVDDWVPWKSWSFPIGADPIVAEWSCGRREWIISDTESSSRLPPKGPCHPSGGPMLLLVTQNHQLHVCCIPPTVHAFKVIRASLLQLTVVFDSHQPLSDIPQIGPGGASVCVSAGIGLGYNSPAIMVATRSHLLPTAIQAQTQFDTMDFELSMGITENRLPESSQSSDCDSWGEQSDIQLCEVVFDFRMVGILMSVRPLAPLTGIPAHVTDLVFINGQKSKSRHVAEDKASQPDADVSLAISTVDFGDYSSFPRSELRLYSFVPCEPDAKISIKKAQLESRRLFEEDVLDFVVPLTPEDTILVGLFETSDVALRRNFKGKKSQIGRIVSLKPPNLSETSECPMVVNTDEVGQDVPINAAISPNHTLLCMLPSPSRDSHFSVHAVPSRHHWKSSESDAASLTTLHPKDVSSSLIIAIRSRNSPADVIQALSLPAVNIEMIVSTLYETISAFKKDSFGLSEIWVRDIMGVATEVYREKAKQVQDDFRKAQLESRWKLARDVGVLGAYCDAFEECQEDELYDLDAVWQLLALVTWLVELVENLLKECILVGDDLPVDVKKEPGFEEMSLDDRLGQAMFLLIVHPYCLNRFSAALAHMKRFRAQVSSQFAKGENAHMAKDILLDITDRAGFDVDNLVTIVSGLLTEVEAETKNRGGELDMCMASCSPSVSITPIVRKAIEKILRSDVIDRPRLFLKPGELIDGIAHLSISEGLPKEKEKDIVTKGVLPRHGTITLCLRCGGKSEVPGRQPLPGKPSVGSVQWQTWEKAWKAVCVCGGPWVHTPVA